MKKARKLGLQSLALVLMAFVLVAGVAFGMTSAWFTDTMDQANDSIQMNANFAMQRIDITELTHTGTRANAQGQIGESAAIASLTDVLPGDTLGWNFDINKDNTLVANSVDFMTRVKVAVYYSADTTFQDAELIANGAKFTLTVGYKYGNGTFATASGEGQNLYDNGSIANDNDFHILPRAVTSSNYYKVAISLTLNGDEFKNEDALKHIKVAVTVEGIQAANYVEANWTGNNVKSGEDKIVAYNEQWVSPVSE